LQNKIWLESKEEAQIGMQESLFDHFDKYGEMEYNLESDEEIVYDLRSWGVDEAMIQEASPKVLRNLWNKINEGTLA
jgi:hypothetical protein